MILLLEKFHENSFTPLEEISKNDSEIGKQKPKNNHKVFR